MGYFQITGLILSVVLSFSLKSEIKIDGLLDEANGRKLK
jgi:hypothetical protein